MSYKLVDTHCHIYEDDYNNDFENVIREIKERMEFIVLISCDYASTLKAYELAEKYNFIYSTIGYHPTDISTFNEKDYTNMLNLAKKSKKIIGMGEIGLDYHWMRDPKKLQKDFFIKQIKDAIDLNLSLSIHTRDATQDTIDILKEYDKCTGILHTFPGSFESYKPIMDRFYVGVSGVLTFKNNVKTVELVKNTPIERLVLETDSPFLTPVPFRGKRNHPIYTYYIAEKISQIKDMNIDDVIRITTENAYNAYKIERKNLITTF